MRHITGNQRTKNRHFLIYTAGEVVQGTNVLGQTRSSKGEAGFQIGPGDVQLVILTEDIHQKVRINARFLAESADFIGKADLQRVVRIRSILDHFGGLNRYLQQWRFNRFINPAQHVCGSIV